MNLKILIVDDEAERYASPLHEMLTHRFPNRKIDFIVCSNYRDSMNTLEGTSLAIIGLDLTQEYNPEILSDFLPHINTLHPGYRLIRFIKEKYPQIKVIVLATTSQCQVAVGEESSSEKNNKNYLSLIKPISASKLIDAIRDTLNI